VRRRACVSVRTIADACHATRSIERVGSVNLSKENRRLWRLEHLPFVCGKMSDCGTWPRAADPAIPSHAVALPEYVPLSVPSLSGNPEFSDGCF